jgi:diguanylate cyclase (GGDEF)-like protein
VSRSETKHFTFRECCSGILGRHAALLSWAALAVVGILDALTGIDFSFALFYLCPILIAGWYGSRRSAFVVAICSGLVWHLAEAIGGRVYSSPWAMPWNAGTRTVLFVLVAMLLLKFKGQLQIAQQQSITDVLTQLANRRHVMDRLEHDLLLMHRAGQPLTVAYIDLDDFKAVNDNSGHAEGDRILKGVSQAIRQMLRAADTGARIGGDEFVIVLPTTGAAAAHKLLTALSQRIQHVTGVGCSVGAVVIEGLQPSAVEALEGADRLMYAAKRGGKARIVVTSYESADPSLAMSLRPVSPDQRRCEQGGDDRHAAQATAVKLLSTGVLAVCPEVRDAERHLHGVAPRSL